MTIVLFAYFQQVTAAGATFAHNVLPLSLYQVISLSLSATDKVRYIGKKRKADFFPFGTTEAGLKYWSLSYLKKSTFFPFNTSTFRYCLNKVTGVPKKPLLVKRLWKLLLTFLRLLQLCIVCTKAHCSSCEVLSHRKTILPLLPFSPLITQAPI